MKKCPFCAEEIQAAAVVCRFCQRTVAQPRLTPIPARQSLAASATIAEYESACKANMTERQQQLFDAEMMAVRRDGKTGMLLAFLLGGVGAHRFYLGDLLGIVYVFFCWTFIPLIVGFIEIFVMEQRVADFNKRHASLIAARILSGPTVV